MKTAYLPVVALLTFSNPAPAAIERPECQSLAQWTQTYSKPEARSGMASIPDLFRQSSFAELFGKPLEKLDGDDFQALDEHMKGCQRELFKQDRQAVKRMNSVRRHLPSAERTLQHMQHASEAVATLVSLPASQASWDLLESIKPVLRGESKRIDARGNTQEVRTALDSLRQTTLYLPASDTEPLLRQVQARQQQVKDSLQNPQPSVAVKTQTHNTASASTKPQSDPGGTPDTDPGNSQPATSVETEQTRQARLATRLIELEAELQDWQFTELSDLGPYLRRLQSLNRALRAERNAEAAKQSGISAEDTETLFQDFLSARDQLYPQFLDYLTEIPATEQGLRQAQRAVARATKVRYADKLMQAYVDAAGAREEEIQASLAKAQQAAAYAREHMDISARLDTLLQGSGPDRANLRTLVPGMATEQAITIAARQWGYQQTPSMNMDIELGPSREDIAKLKRGRHDGGKLTLYEMGSDVGQLEYSEHYKAKMELDTLRQQLSQKFGKPDAEQKIEHGVVWHWQGDNRHLQVKAKNQADVIMYAADFRSRLRLAIWNDHYEDYLQTANKRCERIRKMPQGQRSMDDASFFMKHHCPMTGGYQLKAGVHDF